MEREREGEKESKRKSRRRKERGRKGGIGNHVCMSVLGLNGMAQLLHFWCWKVVEGLAMAVLIGGSLCSLFRAIPVGNVNFISTPPELFARVPC